MKIANQVLCVSSDQNGRILARDLSACGIGKDVVFCKQGKGVDAVGDYADILKFLQVIRDIEGGGGSIDEDDVAVFDKLDRRSRHLFLFKAILMDAEGKTWRKCVFPIDFYPTVGACNQTFRLQGF